MSHSNRNIAHFTEVFNFVYHYLHHSSVYPTLKTIYFPQYQKEGVYPWIINYIEVAKSIFPSNRAFRTVFLEEMDRLHKSGVVCFRNAVRIRSLAHFFYSHIHSDPFEHCYRITFHAVPFITLLRSSLAWCWSNL